MATLTDATLLAPAEWRALEERHRERADRLSSGWRERAGTGRTHPVEDFLFTYYPVPPRVLRRWHPGTGVVLADARPGGERGVDGMDRGHAGLLLARVGAKRGAASCAIGGAGLRV